MYWEIVQRQDTWLWTTVSGFESLSPSFLIYDLIKTNSIISCRFGDLPNLDLRHIWANAIQPDARRAMEDSKTATYFPISIGPPDENTDADIGEFRNIYVGDERHTGDDSQLFGD